MKTWEYKLIDSNTVKKPGLMSDFPPEDVENLLNKLGGEGWEVIYFQCKFKAKQIENFYGIAKRESSGQPQPAASVDS